MLLNSGGHTLNEYIHVLSLPEIQKSFSQVIPDFAKLNLTSLFLELNQEAFQKSLDEAVEYNHQLIQRKIMHAELIEHKLLKNKAIPRAPNVNRAIELLQNYYATLTNYEAKQGFGIKLLKAKLLHYPILPKRSAADKLLDLMLGDSKDTVAVSKEELQAMSSKKSQLSLIVKQVFGAEGLALLQNNAQKVRKSAATKFHLSFTTNKEGKLQLSYALSQNHKQKPTTAVAFGKQTLMVHSLPGNDDTGPQNTL